MRIRVTTDGMELEQVATPGPSSAPESVAVVRPDGTILADTPDSPSLDVLGAGSLGGENAWRPAPETYQPPWHTPRSTRAGRCGWPCPDRTDSKKPRKTSRRG